MNRSLGFLGGVVLGLALMYYADPDRGATRRARLRDRAVRLRDRSQSILGNWRHRTRRVAEMDDALLAPAAEAPRTG